VAVSGVPVASLHVSDRTTSYAGSLYYSLSAKLV